MDTSQTNQSSILQTEKSSQVLVSIDDFIKAHFADDISLDDIANAAKISKFAATRAFHKARQMPPMKWLWLYRIHLSRELIEMGTPLLLTEILTLAGFKSNQHFSRTYVKIFGETPSAARKRAFDKVMADHAKFDRQRFHDDFDAVAHSFYDKMAINFATK